MNVCNYLVIISTLLIVSCVCIDVLIQSSVAKNMWCDFWLCLQYMHRFTLDWDMAIPAYDSCSLNSCNRYSTLWQTVIKGWVWHYSVLFVFLINSMKTPKPTMVVGPSAHSDFPTLSAALSPKRIGVYGRCRCCIKFIVSNLKKANWLPKAAGHCSL